MFSTPATQYFKMIASSNNFAACKSERLSDESIKPSSYSCNSLNPETNYIDDSKRWVKFDGSCLKQKKCR